MNLPLLLLMVGEDTPVHNNYYSSRWKGSRNQAVTTGAHAEDFEARIGKTQFIGRLVDDGSMWEAHSMSSRPN